MTGVSMTPPTGAAATSSEATAQPAATAGNDTSAATGGQATAAVSLSSQQQQTSQQTSQPDPWGTIDPEYKTLAETKGWKSPVDALKSYKELETKFSQTRPVEGPKAVTDYDQVVQRPQNAKDIGYNDDFAKWFKDTAFKNKVPVDAAKGLHDEFMGWAANTMQAQAQAQQQALQTKIEDAGKALVKEWGEPNTPQFARHVEMMRRSIEQLDPGLKDALVESGVIVKVGDQEMVANAAIARSLAKIGAERYAEDSLFGSSATQTNPFDPNTLDLTRQGQLWKQDKAKAKAMIQALPKEHQGRYEYLLGQ